MFGGWFFLLQENHLNQLDEMNRQWLSQWFEGSLWHTSWSCGTSVINPWKSLLPPSLQRSQSFLRISLKRERTVPVSSVQCVPGCAVTAWRAGGCSVPGLAVLSSGWAGTGESSRGCRRGGFVLILLLWHPGFYPGYNTGKHVRQLNMWGRGSAWLFDFLQLIRRFLKDLVLCHWI